MDIPEDTARDVVSDMRAAGESGPQQLMTDFSWDVERDVLRDLILRTG